MTGLELQYRLLMRAYPLSHRTRHEDEIVATLLDVANDDQRRPRFREAAAIVKAGLECRAQNSSELKPGLRLAGLVALAVTFALSTLAIVLATQLPLDIGLTPTLAWLAVVAASVFGTWSASTHRMVPVAALSLVMVVAGSSAMGLRRSTLVPAAMFLILSTYSRPARRSLRLAAATIGIILGSLQGALLWAQANHFFQASDSSWVYSAQWDIVSDIVTFGSPLVFAVCLMTAAAAGLWRLRYAVAAAVLAGPFAALTVYNPRGPLPYVVAPRTAALLSIAAAAVTLGITLRMTWLGHRRTGHAHGHT